MNDHPLACCHLLVKTNIEILMWIYAARSAMEIRHICLEMPVWKRAIASPRGSAAASLLKNTSSLVTSKPKSSLMLFIFKCSPLDRRHLVLRPSHGALRLCLTCLADTKAAGSRQRHVWEFVTIPNTHAHRGCLHTYRSVEMTVAVVNVRGSAVEESHRNETVIGLKRCKGINLSEITRIGRAGGRHKCRPPFAFIWLFACFKLSNQLLLSMPNNPSLLISLIINITQNYSNVHI